MIKEKIKHVKALKKIVASLKRNGKKVVFTNGCFDILHLGHVKYLELAKKKADILIVALNSDSSIRKIKGANRPINNELDRAKLVAALESVDFVTIFKEETPLNIIKELKPDILVKGSDWKSGSIVGADFLKSCGGKISRIRFLNGYSTSKIIKKIGKKTNR